MNKKIGFFGGTFDPIHFGHINLALHMLETQALDEIFICPASLSPHKEHTAPVSKEHRFEMVKLAIEPLTSKFTLIDWELNRPGPSYTINTIHALMQEFKHDTFRLIIGQDVLAGLSLWKDVEELLELAPPLVGARPSQLTVLDPFVKKVVEKRLISTSIMEISSTEIRQRLRQGLFCGHLVPAKVLDYIYANHLYY